MSRKLNGEGSIVKRSDGRFMGEITIGRDLNGRLKRKYVYGKNKQEILQKITKIKYQIHTKTFCNPSDITVNQWINQWLEVYKTTTIREQTLNLYKILNNTIIDPKIGDQKIKNILPMHIQMLINELIKEKYSYSTIYKIKNILYPAFKVAVTNKLIPNNPFENINIPKLPPIEITSLNMKDCLKLERVAKKSKFYECFILELDTGMRCGEILALEWNDINFTKGTVNINKTVIKSYKTGKQKIICQELPKTKSSNRTIPLTKRCLVLLMGLLFRQKSKQKIIFSNDGKYISPDNLRRSLRVICNKAEIPIIGTHVLRHTFATRMFEAAVPSKIISELLGHSKIELTLNTYVTVSDENKLASIDMLEKYLQQTTEE